MAIDELGAEIAERCPDWRRAADSAVEDVRNITGLVITATRARRGDRALATQAIFLQAVNDYTDLILDASCGRGRPAVRSARTLFEHHVAALDVNSEPDLATRWLDHLPMAGVAESQLRLVEQALKGNVLKGYRHRTRKLAVRSNRLRDAAVVKWGSPFQRQWHPRTLYDRAVAHGLEDHYEFYRFASAPVHGSHGGLIGLTKEIDGHQVMRHGPAVAIAPHAVLYGTASMRALTEVSASYVDGGLQPTLDVLDALNGEWAAFYDALRRFDNELWPNDPPPTGAALVIVEVSGEAHWFEYQPAIGRARRALSNEVVIHPEQEHPLQQVLAATSGTRVGICVYDGVVGSPSTEPWLDEAELLEEAPIGIRENGSVEVPIAPAEE